MSRHSDAATLIAEHLQNPDTQWSVGTFGAIAEFSRDHSEDISIDLDTQYMSAVTGRGGIRLSPVGAVRPFASESIGRVGWNQRVALCLPVRDSAMRRRKVLTEIGPDEAPLREADRGAVLFDLGLDAVQVDVCVRVADETVAGELRRCAGLPVFDAASPAMPIILAANPHRVFISRIGRAEVYQAIPRPGGKSPDGPHTHVLPKLLQHRRTHAATEPVPDGFVPCAHLYPANAGKDGFGRVKPFDHVAHRTFQRLLEKFGAREAVDLKARIRTLASDGQGPDSDPLVHDRAYRATVRIALRQLAAEGHSSPALASWLAAYDRGDEDVADDETLTLGH